MVSENSAAFAVVVIDPVASVTANAVATPITIFFNMIWSPDVTLIVSAS